MSLLPLAREFPALRVRRLTWRLRFHSSLGTLCMISAVVLLICIWRRSQRTTVTEPPRGRGRRHFVLLSEEFTIRHGFNFNYYTPSLPPFNVLIL